LLLMLFNGILGRIRRLCVDIYSLWMTCVCLQCISIIVRRRPEIFIASISRSSHLAWKFQRFLELFGNLRKCHEVDRNRLDDLRKIFGKYAFDLPKICQSLGLNVTLRICVKTAEIYVMSNWSDTMNLDLFGKV